MRPARRPFAALVTALAASLLLAAGGCEEDKEDAGAAAGGEVVAVPSGREVRVLDVITNARGTEGAAARFRFVVPGLKSGDDWVDDMQALCDGYAVPRTEGMVPAPQQIIISLSASPVPFGEAAPDVVQLFESYSFKDGSCIWEVF